MARRLLSFLVLALLLAAPAELSAAEPSAEPLLGFTAESSAAQRELESRFDALLTKDNLRAWLERMAARPHPVGSPWGKENAEFMAELFRSWGYETRIEEFQVLFPTPKVRRVEMLEPTPFTAALEEPAIAEDPTSGQKDEQLPPYNAYSIDGDVTGELVYVHYGRPEDYDELDRRGISVEGKIALARYGGAWRGIKPKVAAEHGAVGCLIFSDPGDDGYFAGDTYPEGGYRPAEGVQRGSVADMPLYPGDPLTPGVGATADATRLAREEAPTLTKIPVLPISWADAKPLLEAMGGPVAPPEWRGALPLTYHLGPGPAKVRLTLEFEWGLAPAYDVIAVLRGSERPDQWILRGNHHDAWVNGATDPVSGMVALLEEARAVGELAKAGHPPKTQVFGDLSQAERSTNPPDLRLFALGSGSDYTPFLQHLGIASLNLGFGGEDEYGQYHSIYDSIHHYTHFMDPGFDYGIALARTAGRVMLRLANADLLPFEFTALADEVGTYVKELQELAEGMRKETAETNRLLDENAYTAAADPTRTFVPPEREEPVPHLNFAPLQNAHARLAEAAKGYAEALAGLEDGEWPSAATLAEVDRILYRSERALTRREGLPGREWYVHHLYAPGFYTGYGVKTLPGAREAIEEREWQEAERQIEVAAGLLEGLAAEIATAAELLGEARP